MFTRVSYAKDLVTAAQFQKLILATLAVLTLNCGKLAKKDDPDETNSEITSSCAAFSHPTRTQRSLVAHPTNANIAYVGIEAKGIFMTEDGGTTWTKQSKGITAFKKTGTQELCYEEFRQIVISPSNPKILYAAHMGGPKRADDALGINNGVYYSKDGGASWERRVFPSMNVGIYSLAIDAANPDVIYAGAGASAGVTINTKGTVYRSANAGKDWTELAMAFDVEMSTNTLQVDPTNSNLIYAATWRITAPGEGANGSKISTTQIGIQRSKDAGSTWETLNSGMGTGVKRAIMEMVLSPKNPKIMFLANFEDGDGAKMYYSLDGGDSFRPPTTSSDIDVAAFDPSVADGKTLLGFNISSAILYRSTDGGATWSEFATLPAETISPLRLTNIIISPANSNIVYLSGSSGTVYRSTDGGKTFSKVLTDATLPL